MSVMYITLQPSRVQSDLPAHVFVERCSNHRTSSPSANVVGDLTMNNTVSVTLHDWRARVCMGMQPSSLVFLIAIARPDAVANLKHVSSESVVVR